MQLRNVDCYASHRANVAVAVMLSGPSSKVLNRCMMDVKMLNFNEPQLKFMAFVFSLLKYVLCTVCNYCHDSSGIVCMNQAPSGHMTEVVIRQRDASCKFMSTLHVETVTMGLGGLWPHIER